MRKYKAFKDEVAEVALQSALIIAGVFLIFGVLYGVIQLAADVTGATGWGFVALAIIISWFVSTVLSLILRCILRCLLRR